MISSTAGDTSVVIGSSDELAGNPASDPVSMANVYAMIFHSLFDINELRLARGAPYGNRGDPNRDYLSDFGAWFLLGGQQAEGRWW